MMGEVIIPGWLPHAAKVALRIALVVILLLVLANAILTRALIVNIKDEADQRIAGATRERFLSCQADEDRDQAIRDFLHEYGLPAPGVIGVPRDCAREAAEYRARLEGKPIPIDPETEP